jgi:hypothetical protein
VKLGNGESERLFKAMLATATSGQCLIWTHGKAGRGYGSIHVGPKKIYAHRLAWIRTNGPIPHGKHVLHHCDNPPCFNPYCLFLGTEKDNRADQKSKGRTLIGASNPIAKLTDAEVLQLRSLYRYGVIGHGMIALGKRFGVSHTTAR